MSKKDTRTVAYIFREMDPSEEVEFKRDLMKNDNLLIEVESLKKTSEKIEDLPQFDPPVHIVESVQEFARSKKKKPKYKDVPSMFIAAAAMLVIGLTSGIFLFEDPTSQNNETNSQEAAITGTSTFTQPVNQPSQNNNTNTVSPWVDRNDVLYFQTRNQFGNTAHIDSIRANSQHKLIRVTDPIQTRMYQGHLHLTGNRR